MSILEEKLKNLPDQPGVYIMKDSSGEIIYIGKAVSLKNRVRQYFQASKSHTAKVRAMVSHIHDFEYILTDSELEAFILECNLIKKHRPRYNILLKDDKHYPYIKITMEEDYPRILMTRKLEKDKNRYFGPYTSAASVKETIELIRKIFPIRTCNRDVHYGTVTGRPCLYFHINQCLGPCQGNVDMGEYREMIKQVCKFLEGKHDDLLKELKNKMAEAAENLQFELAALLRDRIASVERILQNQKIISTAMEDQDVIAYARDQDDVMVEMFFIRSGKLMGTEHFLLEDLQDTESKEVLQSFIKQFYLTAAFIPKEILLQEEIDEAPIIERWLSDRRGNRVYVKAPKRGEKRELVEMAMKNAQEALLNFSEKIRREWTRTVGASEELARYIGLDKAPVRIEAFDISNIQGTDSVASMVVFENGKPKSKDYRRFKIKSVQGPNDFASMAEVIGRRFKRGLEEQKELLEQGKDIESGKFSRFPDLLLIDGGKGQLSSARAVLRELGLEHIPTIGLAKQFEEVFMEGREDPIIIPRNSDALHLLQRIRDEAHRFGITYHRSLRGKNGLHSILEDIPGIGPKRRRELLRHFGSIEAIKKASLEDLAKVEGMNLQAAEKIKEYLR